MFEPPTTDSATFADDILSRWSELEENLAILLGHQHAEPDFHAQVLAFDLRLQDLLAQDADSALYVLFQLVSSSSVGYSATHSLICAVLSHITAQALALPATERDSLVRAAITMNIAMVALQDQLAGRQQGPSAKQLEVIEHHALDAERLLRDLGVADELWLAAVAGHHPVADASDLTNGLAALPPVQRLAHILHIVDRYAAVISPRKSRPGRRPTDSARAVIVGAATQPDEVGNALLKALGFCPPGTFVRLDNGETAVVLRRGNKPSAPVVASVLDRQGHLNATPQVFVTERGGPQVQAALAAGSMHVGLDHRQLLALSALERG